jgi:hypothetical protein
MFINETIQKHSKYKDTYYQNTHTLQNPYVHTPTDYCHESIRRLTLIMETVVKEMPLHIP